MSNGLEALANMEYPGRFIIIGRDPSGTNNVIVYGLTGRSPPSQARRFVEDKERGVIRTDVTDKEQLEEGSPALLIYPAIVAVGEGIAVSNGAQTNLIYTAMKNLYDPAPEQSKPKSIALLAKTFAESSFVYDPKLGWIDLTSFEPDPPNNTPRISGCILRDNAAVHIVTMGKDGKSSKNYFSVQPANGQGKLIATYNGINVKPLPSFEGDLLEVKIETENPNDTARAVYEALAPKCTSDPRKDYRVGVVVVYSNIRTLERQVAMINRHGAKS